jgi:hypothetical protein
MARGGKRDGAGRKAGSINKVSAEKRAEIVASGLTPLDYMLTVLRDETAAIDRRDWAAEKAAPYVHPKLAAIEHSGNVTVSHEAALDELDNDDEPEGSGGSSPAS